MTSQLIVVHRWHESEHRILLANVGNEIAVDLASIVDLPSGWYGRSGRSVMFSTAWTRYGGDGRRPEDHEDRMVIPARTAMIWQIGG